MHHTPGLSPTFDTSRPNVKFGAGCVMCLAAPLMDELIQQVQQAKAGKSIEAGKASNQLKQLSGSHRPPIQHAERTRLIPAAESVIPLLEVAALPRLWHPRTQHYTVDFMAGNQRTTNQNGVFQAVLQGLQAVKPLPGKYPKEPVVNTLPALPYAPQSTGVDTPFRTSVIGHFIKGPGTQVAIPLGYITDAHHPTHGKLLLSVRSLPGLENLGAESAALQQWVRQHGGKKWIALESWQTALHPDVKRLGRPVEPASLPADLRQWLTQHVPDAHVFKCLTN